MGRQQQLAIARVAPPDQRQQRHHHRQQPHAAQPDRQRDLHAGGARAERRDQDHLARAGPEQQGREHRPDNAEAVIVRQRADSDIGAGDDKAENGRRRRAQAAAESQPRRDVGWECAPSSEGHQHTPIGVAASERTRPVIAAPPFRRPGSQPSSARSIASPQPCRRAKSRDRTRRRRSPRTGRLQHGADAADRRRRQRHHVGIAAHEGDILAVRDDLHDVARRAARRGRPPLRPSAERFHRRSARRSE